MLYRIVISSLMSVFCLELSWNEILFHIKHVKLHISPNFNTNLVPESIIICHCVISTLS